MLVYAGDKQQFLQDVRTNAIDRKIEQLMALKLHKRVGTSEKQSWINSLTQMHSILLDSEIPGDAGVAIEFAIPNTSKRVDFIISGLDGSGRHSAVIVELKQWSEVFPLDSVDQLLLAEPESEIRQVETYLGGGKHKVVHPSYQAWSYRAFITDYNSNVEEIPIALQSCAYLHNYYRKDPDDPLFMPYFKDLLEESPLFCRSDAQKLSSFIKRYIRTGDAKQTLYYIEGGKIRPSKSLQDALASMLKGNQEFVLIDEQKIVYEQMLAFSRKSAHDGGKRVFLVQGGPGTGKTVVAVNTLVRLIAEGQVCAYVTKNSAPRNVFEAKLKAGSFKRRNISSLFKSSSSFINAGADDFGTLIVDEAHRLNRRSQQGPKVAGEDQIKEIINAANCSIFFLDEDQRVTAQDYGTRERILFWAKQFGAEVEEGRLASQFRCNGSDGYLSWLDGVLGMQSETANPTLDGIPYDFQVIDDPLELKRLIEEKNQPDNKARLVAGYCWEWKSKKASNTDADIVIGDFAMRWNLSSDPVFAISKHSIEQVGCIHTTQGLEFSYVGVIIGADLRFEAGKVVTDYHRRAKTDKSLHGLVGKAKKGDRQAIDAVDTLIRNTYRTLMSRGLQGCYVYCVDKALAQFLKTRVKGYQAESLDSEAAES
ncbi:MAG: DNA/RNA helicase domain-containing protein [Sphaerochaeta sp.]|uniref:DNA/RNA helicase domain-containing protein n=1 Tax=Sphaerochaeta sp. TaxID=1972642 RepID=UPI003D13F4F6